MVGTGIAQPTNLDDADAALVPRLVAGEEAAFRELVARMHPGMMRVARAIAREAAEDVVQDSWAAVVRGIDAFERRSSLKTWILRIVANRANTWLRSMKRRELSAIALDEVAAREGGVGPERFTRFGNWATPPAAWAAQSPEEVILSMEAGAAIARLVEALPDAQRVVVTLRDVEGLSTPEVCDIMEISEGNLRVLLHRARTKLRTELERQLGREPS